MLGYYDILKCNYIGLYVFVNFYVAKRQMFVYYLFAYLYGSIYVYTYSYMITYTHIRVCMPHSPIKIAKIYWALFMCQVLLNNLIGLLHLLIV